MKHPYQRLESQQDETPTLKFRSISASLLLSSAVLFISGVAVLIIALSQFPGSQVNSSTNSPTYTCGTSLLEAQSLGCRFDPLTVAWLHPSCPNDLSTNFTELNFKYYADADATIPLSTDGLSRALGDKDNFYWTSWEEHNMHCVFIILKFYQVVERGGRIDSMSGSSAHAKHCLMHLANQARRNNVSGAKLEIQGQAGFLSC
ncbi:hypothetical protein N431DRAFT_461110 [Stipitochalara longipes BDJ]|nr:hypothetical protein N431DRAFT_461110 [Stipitochalara longipes BDJ]